MDNEMIQPNDAAKMIMPFDVAAIRAEMARFLSIPKCGDYVNRLLDVASNRIVPQL